MSSAVTGSPTPVSTGESKVARLFGLQGDTWMRHANPISVWTRFSCLSLLAIAVWSGIGSAGTA